MEETEVDPWDFMKNEFVESLLQDVCPPLFSNQQLKVLFGVYNDDMAGDSKRFTEWFRRTTSTYQEAKKCALPVSDQELADGQFAPYWPVIHNEKLIIHFRRPIESAANLVEGDCFFDVPFITEEHAERLSFNYVKGSKVVRKPIPSEDLQTAFTEEYLDKLLSQEDSTISSYKLIVKTSQGQIERLPLREFVLHHIEHSNEGQNTVEQGVSVPQPMHMVLYLQHT